MKLAEIEAKGPIKPRTPQQMRAATEKRAEANAKIEDVRKEAQIKVAAARRKAAQT